MMNSYSVFYIEQKTELEKCNCFLVDFLRYSFGRIKVISAVVEREYTPNITRQICFAYQLTGFFMIRGFIEWYFLIYQRYVLENHFYFVNASDYCFEPFVIQNLLCKQLRKSNEGPSTHLFLISSLCTFIIQRKKEISFVAKFVSKYFLIQR